MKKIIAELCQNHQGSFDNVLQMVDLAAANGATHAKIQNIYVKNLVYRPEFETKIDNSFQKISRINRPFENEYSRLSDLELSDKECKEFVKYCKSRDLVPLTTCFARDSISQIKAQGFEEVKVASYDCASYQMVRELRDSFDYIYVSTGATFDEEIKKTHKILSENNSTNFAFLHCVTKYPTPNNMMNMARLDFLKNFSDEVGFSDHSDSNVSGLDAAKYSFVRGATILERHFTILDKDLTKDGKVSINPKELKELKDFAENESLWKSFLEKNKDLCEEMEGSMTRELSDEEISNRIYYRGRFASSRNQTNDAAQMIFNWEETSLK